MEKKYLTLLELLVVIAIIGLLGTIAVIALGSARQKARDSARLSDIGQMQTALELYFTDNNRYPVASNLILGGPNASCLNAVGWQGAGCSNPYKAMVSRDPGNNAYVYTSGAPGTTYTLSATLEGTIGGYSGAIRATPSGIQK